MQLGAYLEREHLTPSDFARKLGVSPSAVTRWVRGERKPSLDQVVEIERETSGEVVALDFVHRSHDDGAAA